MGSASTLKGFKDMADAGRLIAIPYQGTSFRRSRLARKRTASWQTQLA